MLRSASSSSLITAKSTDHRVLTEPITRTVLGRSPSHQILAGLLITTSPPVVLTPGQGSQQLATAEQASQLERCLTLDTLKPLDTSRSKSSSTRQAISKAQQQRWADNPDLRDQVSAKNKGKQPWNKGQKLSESTRQRMSLAKQGSTVPRVTRQKMSKAAKGRSHSQETAALLSQKLSGRPKSAEHRAAIAAAQRRRHAAARVLRAVEDVHRQTQAEGSLGTPRLPLTTASVVVKKGRGRPRKAGAALGSGIGAVDPKQQILEVYKMQLREYRALQDELAPWVNAFEQRTGRKPRLSDVESTKIDWLLEKYKKYVVLRERVLRDTTNLRSMMTTDTPQGNSKATNSSALPATDGPAARMAAALAYKAQRENAGALAGLAAQEAGTVEDVDDSSQFPVTANTAALDSAPPRVKAAMMAAMDYRKKKAAATAAKATAAAVAAELLPETTKPSADKGAEALRQVLAAQHAAAQAVDDAQSAEANVRKALQQITLNGAAATGVQEGRGASEAMAAPV